MTTTYTRSINHPDGLIEVTVSLIDPNRLALKFWPKEGEPFSLPLTIEQAAALGHLITDHADAARRAAV